MIFYFYGENNYELSQAMSKIKTQYINKTGSNADMDTFDMSEKNLSDLLNSLAVVPMFVSSRLIVVKDLSKHKIAPDKLQQLLDSVAESTNVVFVDQTPDKRSSYFKKMSALKNAKEFKILSRAQLVAWLKKEFSQNKATIDNKTISLLIELVGDDQWQLSSEIKKLTAGHTEITENTVKELVVPNINYSAFSMLDYILANKPKKAIEIYKQLKLSAEPDQKILGAITYQYRNLVLAKDNQDKPNNWLKKFHLSSYAASKAQQLCRNLSMEQLTRAYNLILKTDANIKQGKIDASDALENLIIKLSNT